MLAAIATSDAETMITTIFTDIGSVLISGLTTVFATVAVLIGLFFVYRFAKRQIGRGK